MPELDPIFVPVSADFRELAEDVRAAADPAYGTRLAARRRARERWRGLTDAERHYALYTAFVIWTVRRPWRWIPSRLQPSAFAMLGRRFSDRIVVKWYGAVEP